jgi:hypothetical protein
VTGLVRQGGYADGTCKLHLRPDIVYRPFALTVLADQWIDATEGRC